MNSESTTTLNSSSETRRCAANFVTASSSSASSSAPSSASSFSYLTANRCDSVGEFLESASSTTSNSSDLDQTAAGPFPFPLYPLPCGNEVNSFFGFTASGYKTQHPYPYQYPPAPAFNSFAPSEVSQTSTGEASTCPVNPTTPSSSIADNDNLNSAVAGDLIAGLAAAAAAASTSSASSTSTGSSSASSARSSTTITNGIPPLNESASGTSSSGGGSTGATAGSAAAADDHLQRLAQMTHGVGLVKSESDNTDATVANLAVAAATADVYHTAAAAYAQAQAYGNWQNYYSFNNQMAPAAAAFPTWPGQCYPPTHWAQTKKGRQTYQRYQTSVLESKFQQSSYVSKKQREELRVQTNLTDRQIKIWFQNRRMKAKKEKNRSEEQVDHQPLMPPNPPKNMMSSSHPHQGHLGGLMDDSIGLGIDQDKLKAGNPSGSMLTAPGPGQMWCPPVMNGGSGMHGMVSMADTMASWPMLPPGTQLHSHAGAANAGGHQPYSMGYPVCPPNI